ncbi:MAG: hypothetical protein O7G83_17140 [Proteobacteria bacterium]|nr:hypothetical protein [Pseudomonadota bacterium]
MARREPRPIASQRFNRFAQPERATAAYAKKGRYSSYTREGAKPAEAVASRRPGRASRSLKNLTGAHITLLQYIDLSSRSGLWRALGVGEISSAGRNDRFDQTERIGADIAPALPDSANAAGVG